MLQANLSYPIGCFDEAKEMQLLEQALLDAQVNADEVQGVPAATHTTPRTTAVSRPDTTKQDSKRDVNTT